MKNKEIEKLDSDEQSELIRNTQDENIIRMFADDKTWSIQVANNPYTPTDILIKLSDDTIKYED